MLLDAYRLGIPREPPFRVYVSTVQTVPLHFLVSLEHCTLFHVRQELPVAFLMFFLDLGYLFEALRNVIEAFFMGDLLELGV